MTDLGALGPLLARHRHVVGMLAAALGIALVARPLVRAGDRRVALAEVLARRGLVASPDDIQWADRPSGLLGGKAHAIVRAPPAPGEPNDVYLVPNDLTPEGVLLRVGDAYNVTETIGADESRPIVHGRWVAYVARPTLAELAPTVHVLDLDGQPLPNAGEWTRLERAQNALTNAQQTGQLRGIGKRTFAIDKRAVAGDGPELAMDEDGVLTVRAAPERVVRIRLTEDAKLPDWIHAEASDVARPGNLVTWSVDRVRSLPWVGDDAMQTVKAVAFTALDFVMRNKERVTGDTGAQSIAEDLGKTELDAPIKEVPVDPEIGWPPPPLETWVPPALPGEGQWNLLEADPFIRRNEGLPPAFATTYIRSDRTRKATRVYVAVWDPRQVELHMMAGTVEPKGATGEAGPGLIPRTPEVMKRVVAASNAGFQALHGEYGMMADGVVYLPPKPYAATVAALRDGTTGFGTWSADPSIPDFILSYRQNMTVMVQDEKFNPFGRTWWGGTPPGWADKTHTVRTGICLTKEQFVAYFYGNEIGPEALSQAMIQARCSYGLALDMNSGHAGLEFYKVDKTSALEPIGRPLQESWEAQGEVPLLEGWSFHGRRLIRGMGLMHFPRYIKREARDFFYMTLRHVLPGPPLATTLDPPLEGEGQWRVKGLPQRGFPYAMATTSIRASATTTLTVLRVDPRTVGAPTGKDDKTVLVVDAGEPDAGATSLWRTEHAFSIATTAPAAAAVRLATGRSKGGGPVAAAVGVGDEDGMLVYVEASAPTDGKTLDAVLGELGCSTHVHLGKPIALALGGDTDLTGHATRAPTGANAVRLVRALAPGAKRILEDTPIVAPSVWYPLQQERIRYFKKPVADPLSTKPATEAAAEGTKK